MNAFEEQRDAANLRSITRSDPSVLEIIETSVHSTIYHYIIPDGQADGEWMKQKAEGPMFIVRRNTNPEYAIFMLNRATLKNVTIPLIKGEIKVEPVGGEMLQIRRRGEKTIRGVWFAEAATVAKFEQGIIRICGLPSQKPGGVNAAAITIAAAAVNRPAIPPTAADMTGGDGFSRLFAGLLSSPAVGSSTPLSAPSHPTPALPSPPAPQHLHQPIPSSSNSTSPFPSHPQPSSHPISPDPHAGVPQQLKSFPPLQDPFTPPPGQTVDDLLNSILGVGAPMGGFMPPPPGPAGKAHPFQAFQHQAPPHLAQQQALPPPGTAPHIPLESKPEAHHHQTQDRSPSAGDRHGPSVPPPIGPTPGQPGLMSPMNANDLLAGIQANFSPPPQHHHQQQQQHAKPLNANDLLAGIQSSQFAQQHFSPSAPPLHPTPGPAPGPSGGPTAALVESVVDALGGVPDLRPGGREGFVRVLEGLVRNEPRFVDDIWQGYLRRMGG